MKDGVRKIMKKNKLFLLLVLFIFTSFLNAQNFEDIKDIEKIRWIDCGEDLMDYQEIESISFCFYLPPGEKYYKYAYNYYDTNKFLENEFVNDFSVINEYRENYFIVDGLSRYYTNEYIDKLISSGKIKKDSPERFFIGNIKDDFIKFDGKAYVSADLSGKYKKKDSSNLDSQLFIQKMNTNGVVGSVRLSNNNYMTYEGGKHLVSYNMKKKQFISDGTFSTVIRDDKEIANDNFTIDIIYFDENKKMLLLNTPKYTRPFVPVEDFFTPNTNTICIKNHNYTDKPLDINIYENNSFDSQILFTFKSNKTQYAKVIIRDDIFREYDNQISCWVKVCLKNGIEGWVWGRNVDLFESPTGFDHEKVLRYTKYNKIK